LVASGRIHSGTTPAPARAGSDGSGTARTVASGGLDQAALTTTPAAAFEV
jgi:hypothetical protein